MPHYNDGTKVQPGDIVAGKSINTGQIVGVVLGITGTQKCNLIIAHSFKQVTNVTTTPELGYKAIWDFMDEIAAGRRRRLMAYDTQLLTGGSISGDSILVSKNSLMDFEVDYGDADQFVNLANRERL